MRPKSLTEVKLISSDKICRASPTNNVDIYLEPWLCNVPLYKQIGQNRSMTLRHKIVLVCMQTSLSKILMMTFVNDISLSWLQSFTGDSLGMGDTFASFHSDGTV